MEDDLIIEMWDLFKEYMTDKNKFVAADQYVEFLIGKDVEDSVMLGLKGYDVYLDQAIAMHIGAESCDDDEDFDEVEDEEDD